MSALILVGAGDSTGNRTPIFGETVRYNSRYTIEPYSVPVRFNSVAPTEYLAFKVSKPTQATYARVVA